MTDRIDAAKNIKLLVEIQVVAETLFTMDQENNNHLNKLQQIEKDYENAEKECINTEKEIQSTDKEILTYKNKIDTYIERIKLLKDKEKYIKTQKEYIALDTEISLAREEIAELEKQTNKENTKNISLNEELKKKKALLEEKQNEFTKTKKEVNQKLKETKTEMNNARKTKEKITPELDPYILRRYEHIVKNKNGVGIVPIINGNCEGCYIAITPQVMSRLMQNREIIYCPNCARILYLPQKNNTI